MDDRPPTADRRRSLSVQRSTFNVHPVWLHVALIVLVAAFFRLWQIDTIPPGLFGDEATDGLDALDVLAGRGAVFFPANFGREGLHMWLVAGMFRLVGVTPLALRLPSALAGILTALATYWLGRELTADGRPQTADDRAWRSGRQSAVGGLQSALPLLAALYVATSYWHVHFSRFGIRGVFTPLCGALAFAAFWRGVNVSTCQRSHVRTLVWFALSGLFLGLATHFYTASRFFPFFLGGFLVLQGAIALITRPRDRAILRQCFGGIVVLFVVAALIFAPLAIYFLQHPGSFTQRASEVAATKAADPLARMGQAALANVAQFVIPGRGDPEQFYNLPRRAVFDPITALLALIGLGVLLWRWKHPAALFLLTWFAALVVPSFLATDRWPTLPRVLGVIPAVYFFPAVGLACAAWFLSSRWRGEGAEGTRSRGAEGQRGRGERLRTSAPLLLCAAALLIHAGLSYRDYFITWGPSQATYDAFEGDMTSVWRWLGNHAPEGHVYLSSDIYRHPTFMLLGERATVQTYFEHTNPALSWFDGRAALPLPPPGEPATYLIGSGAPLAGRAADILGPAARERDRVAGPNGSAALIVIELPGDAPSQLPDVADLAPVAFTDRLSLTGGQIVTGEAGTPWLVLSWRTTGPDPSAWSAYRLEIAGLRSGGEPWQDDVPFEAFRPPEWVPGGRFITWHKLDVPGAEPLHDVRLRLLRADDRQPLAADGGWHAVALTR
jgi:4-amino-4-deoxy-L-arabinose transferase-like glycosyltransferase